MRRIALYEKFNRYLQKMHLREITVTNNETSDLSGFQIPIEIGGDFLDKANPNNLILTIDDEVIPYWVEQWRRPSGKARIWTKLDLSASGSETIKLYYGGFWDNPPNGNNVFELFDDFDGDDLDTDKWTHVADTVSFSNNNILLSGDGQIESVQSFGSGYIFESRCYATEQDSNFLRLYIDSDNFVELGNSDADEADNFEKIRLRTKESGTYYDISDEKLDFRGVHKRYKLKRRDNNYIDAYQEDDFIGTQSTHILSGDMKLRFNVWDSSQNSTLYLDWVFVRKYTANEPSVSVGSEQVIVRAW